MKGNDKMNNRALSYNKIKEFINNKITGNGCELITSEKEFEQLKIEQNLGNSRVKFKVLCKCTNDFSVNWNSFQNKNQKTCKICSNEYRNNLISIPYTDIFDYIKENNCDLLTSEEEYKKEKMTTKDKLKIKCKCGKNFNTSFINFKHKNKKQCNVCSKKHVYTHSEVKQFIEIDSNSGCKLMTAKNNYKNHKSDLSIKCNCGELFNTTFYIFKDHNKRQCRKCSNCIVRSYIETKEFIEENSKCKLLSKEEDYINGESMLELQCECENIFNVTFHRFKDANKRQCNTCGRGSMKIKITKTHDKFCEEVEEMHPNNEYSVLTKYVTAPTKVLMKHNICGYEWMVAPYAFINLKSRCPECYGGVPFNLDIFKDSVHKLYKDEYIVLGEYINIDTPIEVIHNISECMHKWKVIPYNFLKGHECPECNKSKGEKRCKEILEKKKYFFDPQYFFNDLVSDLKFVLKFDFAIFENEEKTKLKFLLEFDGEFHYRKIISDYKFEKQQYHDKLKNEYCEKNNIRLIRIPYWDFDNIEDILSKELEVN